MRPRPCLTCGALTLSSYCPLHKGTGQRGSGNGWLRVRALVLARDGYACVVCGRVSTGLEVGHVIPKRKGGSDDPSNLRTLCRAHHEDKGGVRRAYKGASAREP
ncbi:MAG: HNH endonuclease [Actinomycetota bacterium]|jgi:5-methylcytosine-specific restriction endonuclease McrA|nr:HNH endonuclease [Actinomycetota bacterium]